MLQKNKRKMHTLILPFPSSDLEKASRKIVDFCDHFRTEFDVDDTDVVYCLSVQFFELTN